MVTQPATTRDLLDRADAARVAGRGDAAACLYDEAAARCRAEDDLDGWTEAVLGAASVHLFGVDPGKVPAQLYDVLARTTDDATRARLAAALARCWAYAGQVGRAVRFADEAVERAGRAGSSELLADCLDAALAAHWGPDELDVRRFLAARLDDVAAHVLDPDVRLQAHLWGLHVACEALDLQAMHRQMRVLERLGEESDRALFFAASRRLMLDLLRGRTDTATRLTGIAAAAAEHASLADAWMVLKAMDAYTAAQSGDVAACAAGAAECEAFGLSEGATAVCAEAAFLWSCAGRTDRARALVDTFHGRVLDELPRDVNWLLTLQCVLEAALAVGDREVVERASMLLASYEGRAVVNAGAVMFHGVTDDTLARAAALLGDGESAQRLRARALATYERLGARWWRDRLTAWTPPASSVDDHPEARSAGLALSATPASSVDDAPHARSAVLPSSATLASSVDDPPEARSADPASSAAPASSGPESALRRVHLHPVAGGLWLVGPDQSAAPLRALRGFGHLRELLRRPGRPITAIDLVGAGTGVAVQPDLGDLLDERAVAAYRHRLRDLEEELTEAEQWSDVGRLAGLRAERDALVAELTHAAGLYGRARPTGSSAERARVAVQKAIAAAIDRIGTVDTATARHLRTTVHTGLHCSYDPDPDLAVHWLLD